MKKLAILIVAVVVAFVLVVVIGAKITSAQIETKLEKFTTYINTQSNNLLAKLPDSQNVAAKVEIKDLQKHWFSSDVTFVASFYQDETKVFSYAIPSTINHGPFPLSRLTQLKLKPVAFVNNIKPIFIPLPTKTPITFNLAATVDYSKNFGIDSFISPIDFEMYGQTLKTSKINLQHFCDHADNAECKLDVAIDKLHLDISNPYNSANIVYNLDDYQASFASKKVAKFDYLRDLSSFATNKNYHLNLNTNDLLKYQHASSAFNFTTTANTSALNLSSSTKGLAISNAELGNLDIKTEITSLNAQALNDLIALFIDSLSNKNSLDQELVANTALNILQTEPVLTINNISLAGAEGESKLNLAINLRKPAVQDLAHPEKLMPKLIKNSNFHLEVSEKQLNTLYTKAVQFVNSVEKIQNPASEIEPISQDKLTLGLKLIAKIQQDLINTKFLVKNNDLLSLDFSYADNKFKINQQEFASPEEFNDYMQKISQQIQLNTESILSELDNQADKDANAENDNVAD